MTRNPEFMRLLTERGFVSAPEAAKLLADFEGDALSVLAHLAGKRPGQRSTLGNLWGDSLGVAHVDLSRTLFQHDLVLRLPEDFAKSRKVIPLYRLGEAVTLATADVRQEAVLKEAGRLLGSPVSPVFAFPDDISDALAIEYQSGNSLIGLVDKITESSLFKGTAKITDEQMKKLAGDQGMIEFTRGLLLYAVREQASDVHVEPGEDGVLIRLRIDGVLQERLKLESALLAPLVSRLKILARLDIVEKRRPQDGRITLSLTNRSLDFRFSSVPTIYGEKLVLRVLGLIEKREVPDLSELDFSASVSRSLKRIIETPNGVFFVTGPTGSGKTTTLYAILKHLNRPGVNIMTIEDPVEYRLPGVNQVQVNHAIELDFGSALRSFLRQDPDIILVGEIRDMETAKIASQAALTGHLVLTTMHTNNSLQAVTRLIEIGVEPFLVAPSIIGVMAQRLVRRICSHCREKYRLTPEEVAEIFITDGEKEVFFFRGKGCDQCGMTGYSGRLAIHELFIVNSEMRRLVSRGASILDIQEAARRAGYQPLRYDGIKKVLRGLTTLEEVNRVTAGDEL